MIKFIAASWILIHYMLDLASDPNSAVRCTAKDAKKINKGG